MPFSEHVDNRATYIEESYVPDLTNEVLELQTLQEQLDSVVNPPVVLPVVPEGRGSITLATLKSRPINEYDPSLDIGRMAFPTLFPNGTASFHTSRPASYWYCPISWTILSYIDIYRQK